MLRRYREWLEQPLDICHLGNIKLAGAPKSVDVHERARAFVSKIDIDDKVITAWIPRYRAEERAGLVHAVVGKKLVTDKWSNEVLVAHVTKEVMNVGRSIMQWIFQHGVPKGQILLSAKSRDLAEYVTKTLGVQEECAAAAVEEVKFPKRTGKLHTMGPSAMPSTFIDIDGPAESVSGGAKSRSGGNFAAMEYSVAASATKLKAETQANAVCPLTAAAAARALLFGMGDGMRRVTCDK